MKAIFAFCVLLALGLALTSGVPSSSVDPASQDAVQVPTQLVQVEPPLDACSFYPDWSDEFLLPNTRDENELIRVGLSWDTHTKKVFMDFSYPKGDPNAPLTRYGTEQVEFPVSYWPVSARHLGGNRIAVAGKHPISGLTVVEVWEIKNPTLIMVPGGANTADTYFFRPSSIDSVRTAFAPSKSSGFGLVRAMWPNRVLGGHNVIVMSYASRKVYMIDLSKGQGTAKLVLSPSIAVAGNQAEPGLTQNWPSYGGPNRHAQLGDLYELTRIGHVLPTSGGSDGDDIHSLFVWDTDLDGTPDRSELMTANLYAQLGLEDSDEWE